MNTKQRYVRNCETCGKRELCHESHDGLMECDDCLHASSFTQECFTKDCRDYKAAKETIKRIENKYQLKHIESLSLGSKKVLPTLTGEWT